MHIINKSTVLIQEYQEKDLKAPPFWRTQTAIGCLRPLNLINPALVQIIVFFVDLIPVLEIVISVVRPSVHLLVLLLHLVLILILLLILIIIFLLLYKNRGLVQNNNIIKVTSLFECPIIT